MSTQENSIHTLPWPEVRKLVDDLRIRRGITKRDFAILMDEEETAMNKFLKGSREPGRPKIIKMVSWYEHNTVLQEQFEQSLRVNMPSELPGDWAPMVPMLNFN